MLHSSNLHIIKTQWILVRVLNFGRSTLEQIPNQSRFSTSMMKGSTQTINGNHIKFSLPKELEQKILSFCQNTSITEFSIHLAMAAYVLARMSSQRDICMGVPVANRTYEQDFEAIGNYVNVVPFRINFTEDATLTSISEKIAQDYAEIIKYEHIPIEKIIPAVLKVEIVTIGHYFKLCLYIIDF